MSIYRLLLLLYPASFRAEYGSEMTSIFATRLRQAGGPFAVALLWLETIVDIVLSGTQAHWDILRQDLRYGARNLRRSPGFAITAVLVAALGVGATTAAYTLVNHVLLRPLPFPDADRLVKVWEDMSPGSYHQMEPSPANYRDWKRMSHSFIDMAAARGVSASLVGEGEPERVEGTAANWNLFPMLGAHTIIGRLFTSDDDRPGAPATMVLSYGLWQQKFGAQLDVIGRRVLLDGSPVVVIGVMNPGFVFPRPNTRFWTAMQFVNSDFEDRSNNYLRVVAKLRPGVSREQASAEMKLVSERLRRAWPKDNEHVGVTVNPLRDEISNRARLMLKALLGASFCVLLIACTNLANLLLARSMARRREVAIRNALGAGRERLIRQLLTESIMLALLGGGAGVLAAVAAVPLLATLVPSSLPISATPRIDGRVLAFAFCLTVVTGIFFGALPAAKAPGDITASGLQEGGRQGVGGQRQRLRWTLVMVQTAISFVLLVCTGLLFRTLWNMEQTNPGFRADGVLTMRTALPMPQYEATERRVAFYTRVLSAIRQLPGVTAAAYASFLPMVDRGGIWPVSLPGQAANTDRAFHQASLRYITPDYFGVMAIPLLRGRGVAESDTTASQYVAIVSDSFVRQFLAGLDPLGRQFDFGSARRTVVGVVGNVRVRGMEQSSEPQVYLPYRQVPDGWLIWYAPKDLVIRYSSGGEQLMPAIRRIIANADSQLPISDVQTLTDIVHEDMAPRRLQARVLAGFAVMALLLAGIGTHGLLSYAVSSRSQEIGVRIAVGAQTSDIVLMVIRESASLVLAGVFAGALVACVFARMLESLLAGTRPWDVTTWSAAAALMLVTALAGSLRPTVRASRIDPLTVIRSE